MSRLHVLHIDRSSECGQCRAWHGRDAGAGSHRRFSSWRWHRCPTWAMRGDLSPSASRCVEVIS